MEKPLVIPGTVLRDSDVFTPSECSECGVAVVVGIQVAWRTLKAIRAGSYRKEDWRIARYCRACAVKNGDLEP